MNGRACAANIAMVAIILLLPWGCSAPKGSGAALTDRTAAAPPTLIVSAVPAYRLLVYPDLPSASRLFIVRARVEPIGDDLYHFTPIDVHLVLPDGTTGRAFDHAQARALLDTLDLADVQPAPVSTRSGQIEDGRLAPGMTERLRQDLGLALLDEGLFMHSQPIDGYVVVDAGHPLSSLDGAALEVAVSRVGDGMVAKERYQFGAGATAGGETPGQAAAAER